MSSFEACRPKFGFVLNDELTFLVIGGDPVMRELARVHLSTPTVGIVTADSAEEALDGLACEPFDAVMIDLDLPGKSGLQLIREIRTNPCLRHLPIIAVTSQDDVVSVDGAYNAGATSFATKPVNWPMLSCQLRYVLRAQGLIAA
ncbi:MAG: afsQ1 [Hyphomicrobiales bacterium]|nr:afsQ1 [Hyphomicrobiales bacterium]